MANKYVKRKPDPRRARPPYYPIGDRTGSSDNMGARQVFKDYPSKVPSDMDLEYLSDSYDDERGASSIGAIGLVGAIILAAGILLYVKYNADKSGFAVNQNILGAP